MRKLLLLLMMMTGIAAILPDKANATTIYVDAAKADNTGDGLSWATAKKDVQAAINIAVTGDNVWVKAGTYLPTMDPSGNASPIDPRDKTIYLKSGVKLYGSFVGTETTLSQRTGSVIIANPSTLSGDIGTSGNNTDNCYHVVLSVSDVSTTVLDGFIVSGAYSLPTDIGTITVEAKIIPKNVGGGLYTNISSVTVSSCGFNSNVAGLSGGAMYNSSGNPTLFNCIFITNVSTNGGAISNVNSAVALKESTSKKGNLQISNISAVTGFATITNCQFYGNRALGGSAGAIFNGTNMTSTAITNTTFHNNIADGNGGAICNNAGSHTLTNCSFYNNQGTSSTSLGGALYFGAAVGGVIKNTILYNDLTPANTTDANREEIYKLAGTTLTTSYSIVKDYVSPGTTTSNVTFGSGMLNNDPLYISVLNLSIQAGSPAIDASDPTTTTPPADITGYTRTGIFDMGAYEYRYVCQPTVSTTTLTVCDSLEWNGIVYRTSGTYSKTGLINAAGCDSTAALELTVNHSSSSASIVSVCNSYFWNDSTYKQSGVYTWLGTNTAGCDSTATLYLSILSVTSTYTKTDAACAGSATGSITITPTYGVAPYSYRLGTVAPYGSSNTFTGLRAGSYRVSILDANGCAGISDQIIIGQQPGVTGTFTKTDAGCYGASDGSITVTPTNGASPYQYKIGTSGVYGTSPTFMNLKAGTYRVYIQDANGCVGYVSVVITGSPAITGTFTKTDLTCYGKATGTLTVTPTSGVSPFTYRYGTTGTYGTSNTFTGLRAGNLRVFIKDDNGCVGSIVATLNQPTAIRATSTKTDESCPGAKDGTLTVTATGGTPPYLFRFGSVGSYTTTNTFNNLKAGSYRVYIQDANGCSGYSILTVISQTATTCNPNKIVQAARNNVEMANISLFPNPSTNQFKLTLPSLVKTATVRVMDVNGKIIYTSKSTGNQSITLGESFAPGIYLIEVRQGDVVKTLKAVKN